MTPEMRRAETAPTVSALNFENPPPKQDFDMNFTTSQQFWIGLAIGFSIAIAVLPY